LRTMLDKSHDDKIIIFDGTCGLCHAWVRFIIRFDDTAIFRFASAQSEYGQTILERLNMQAVIFETMLYVEQGAVYTKSESFLKIVSHLPMPVRLLSCLNIFPGPLRDFVYDRIARNRYKLFGLRDMCLLTDGRYKDRFL